MRREEKNSIPSCLSGGFILVFTSYSNNETTINNVMVPIDRIEQDITSSTDVATELTKAILLDAIKWLKSSTEELSSDDKALDWEGLLKLYLKTLSDKIRCLHHPSHGYFEQKKVVNTMRQFIRDRTWSESNDAVFNLLQHMDEFLEEGKIDFSRLCTQARRFIYKRIARQTKVVAHILDGNHRIAALEFALGAHSYSDINNSRDKYLSTYVRNLPHAETKITLRVIVLPPGPLKETFAINMREISAKAQVAVGRMKPHGSKIFYSIMIEKMRESCKRENMHYLLGSNDEISEDTIQLHIESCAQIILAIIEKNAGLYSHMVGDMELKKGLKKKLEDGMDLFKTKEKKRYTYHWDSGYTSVYKTFLATQDFHKPTRYHSGFPAALFELVQVLLWTRISQDCDNLLYRFFQHSNPSTMQLSAGSVDQEAKWVTCMITTVGTSVYYSNAVLVLKKKKKKRQDPCLVPKLISSAVSITTQFFSMRGIDPILPEWFVAVSDKLENWEQHEDMKKTCLGILQNNGNDNTTSNVVGGKGLGLPKDYLTFIVLAFALHLQNVIFEKTGGRSRMKITAEMVNNESEVIIGKEHLVQISDNEQSLWTTRIDEFEEIISAENSSMTFLCLKSSLNKFSKTKESKSRNEVEHLTEEPPVQLDPPDGYEYSLSSRIVKEMKQNDQSSFSQWLIRLLTTLDEGHPYYDEAKDLLEILGIIDHQLFEDVYVEGIDEDE
jgi:hypothetical protein